MDDKHREFDGREVELPTIKSKFTLLVEQAQDPESKNISDPLKNVYPRRESTQVVINSNKLSKKEEKELITLLDKYKKWIGWSISDIKGLNPFGFV